jgi:hypothetical protein
MAIDLDTRLKIPDSVLCQKVSGESVLLDLDTEQYFGLDDVGSRIWSLIVGYGRLRDVRERMHEEYDVDPMILDRDLLDLANQLLAAGLVLIDEGAAADAADPQAS